METLHTFVVCAYGQSAYLEDCVKSLCNQTAKSDIIISTSTPNEEITRVAEAYGIPVRVNEGEAGITGDWNFGLLQATASPYVTIAHQDDIYEPTYTEEILVKAQKSKTPLLIFTDYYEIKNGERITDSQVQKIKRLMNIGFRMFPRSKFARSFVLSMGNSICCPTVTYATAARYRFRFNKDFRFACDWDAWERIGRRKGAFLYIKKPLVGHRIHEDSETSKIMEDGRRTEEEYYMFRRFWPKFIADLLQKYYSKGAENNNV